MRRQRALVIGVSCLLAGAQLARGDEAASAIAWVGDSAVGGAELARRLGDVPSYQLAGYGPTLLDRRRAFLDQVIAAERRLDLEAKRRGLLTEPGVRDRVRGVLVDALLEELGREAEAGITRPDVERRYAEHQARYAAPRRLRLFRILLADEAQARRLIADVTGPKALQLWTERARKLSIDQATAMRRGDLGMVYPDGRTDVPAVRVDPALYAAADAVDDGELVAVPVREGERYAVVWRRGSVPPRQDSLQDLEPTLRRVLARERATQAVAELLSARRRTEVKQHDPSPIVALPAPAVDRVGPLVARSATPHAASALPAPSPGDRGLR